MNKVQALAQIFKLEPGEERPFLLLLAHSFFLGLSLIAFFTASNALFLAQFEAKILPFVYMGGAVAGTASGWLYNRLKQRFPPTKLLPGTLLLLFLSVCGFWLALELTDSLWPVFALLTWHTVLAAMMSVVFWGLAGQIFNVRQGKRLFGITGSGELLAAMLGGLGTPLFVSLFGTVNLLLVSAAGLFLCLLVLLVILRTYGERLSGAASVPTSATATAAVEKSRFVDLLKDPYIRSILLLATVGVIAFRFVDYVFLDLSRERYTDADELARFFGLFFGITQGLTLVVLTGFTGRVISRFGIAAGLGVRRKSLTVFTVLMIGLSFWSAEGAVALFWLASATKMVDLILGRSLTGPSFLILYQPLRAEKRIPTQLAVASTFGPIAGGLAGAVLLLMNQLDLSEILYFNLALIVVLLCWRTVSRRANAGYLESLPKALERRRLEGTALALDEVGLIEALTERLDSNRPLEVIYALDLLVKSQPEQQDLFLVELLEHPHPQVRREVLQRIFRDGTTRLQDAVKDRVERETEPLVRAAAVLALCELSESEAVDSVGPLLDAEEPEVRRAAMAGLLRRGGIDGILLAGERLIALERSEHPHEREQAASILGEVGERSFYRQLLPLLEDPEPRVRRAALAAAGSVRNPRLWPVVLSHLSLSRYESSAVAALIHAGEAALPALAQALDGAAVPARGGARLADICGRIGGESAVRILATHIDCPDRITRLEALVALERCHFRPASGTPIAATTHAVLQGELDDAAWILGAIVDLGHGADFELLRSALEYRLSRIRRRCLLLLSFLYDAETMKRVGHQLENAAVDQRAIALEILDTTLPRKLKRTVLPLFEGTSSIDCLRKLEASFPQRPSDRTERLRSFLTDSDRNLGSWVQACALHTAGSVEDDTFLTQMREMRSSENEIVRETAWWAVSRLDRGRDAESLTEAGLAAAAERDQPTTSGRKSAMLLTVEKVIVLKSVSVFAEVPEEILADLSGFLDEIEIDEGEPVYEKGVIGRTMYIVADGKVRIHDGDRTFVELGPGEFFGELTTLDPEPHSASATALVDSQLLGLDRDALYDVMALHSAVLRGLVHALCQRLRDKGGRGA